VEERFKGSYFGEKDRSQSVKTLKLVCCRVKRSAVEDIFIHIILWMRVEKVGQKYTTTEYTLFSKGFLHVFSRK
jgi:hypothetical protein